VRDTPRLLIAGSGAVAVKALEDRCRAGNTPVSAGHDVDWTDRGRVDAVFKRERPECVVLLGGRSGGIQANQKYPADLMLDNLLVECHAIDAAHRHGVKKLLYLASSCSYPRLCPQPAREDALLTGSLEPTNEAYAVAKIAGIKLCQAYRRQYGLNAVCAIPANIFGPGDDFSLDDSHVVAALIRRMHEAKVHGGDRVVVWGTGAARRDFIFAEDLADACLFLMRSYDDEAPINVGSGTGATIGELAAEIKAVTGFRGRIEFDAQKPDGMPVKVLDVARLRNLGWQPCVPFRAALERTYEWYLQSIRSGPADVSGSGKG
jgi:GDP-L-fucose synthase